MTYEIRTTRVTVIPPNEPLFSETATHVTIVDEAAGEYLEVTQQSAHAEVKEQTIMVTPDEWPVLREAIGRMIAECRDPGAPPKTP